MSEWRHFAHIVKTEKWHQTAVLCITFLFTVIFDLVVAIVVGMVLHYVIRLVLKLKK